MNIQLLTTYEKFLNLRFEAKGPGELADYNWYSLPDTLPFEFMPYSQMLADHSREVANSINELYRYVVNIQVWEQIFKEVNEELKHELIIEMVDPFATLAINLIYIIKSRFIFSIAHLCHQANMFKFKTKWKDNLPNDEEIYFKHADETGSSWRSYKKLKLSLEKTGNKQFTKSTSNFRNKYNHRYSPRIEIGHTGFVKRKRSETKISYGFGPTEPLTLSKLTPILSEQYTLYLQVYSCYKKLIFDHLTLFEESLKEYNSS